MKVLTAAILRHEADEYSRLAKEGRLDLATAATFRLAAKLSEAADAMDEQSAALAQVASENPATVHPLWGG